MKRFIFTLICFATVSGAVSCLPEDSDGDSYQYTLTAFGSASASTFTSDEGSSFTINADRTDGGWKNAGRILAVYQMSKEKGVSDPTYTLLSYNLVKMQSVLVKSTTPESEYAQDPVCCLSATLTGTGSSRYLNFELNYATVANSSAIHTFYILLDDEKSDKQTVHIYLTQDAGGETISEGGLDGSSVKIGEQYVSIPLSQVIPEDAGSTFDLTIHYDWYVYNATTGSYSEETSARSIYGSGIKTQ